MKERTDARFTSKRLWAKEARLRRDRRVAIGLSQEVVGLRLGVSGATICRWENGAICPNLSMTRAWDDALFEEAE